MEPGWVCTMAGYYSTTKTTGALMITLLQAIGLCILKEIGRNYSINILAQTSMKQRGTMGWACKIQFVNKQTTQLLPFGFIFYKNFLSAQINNIYFISCIFPYLNKEY